MISSTPPLRLPIRNAGFTVSSCIWDWGWGWGLRVSRVWDTISGGSEDDDDVVSVVVD